jgi:anaerobic selenocysteine-containing dehydrogenase
MNEETTMTTVEYANADQTTVLGTCHHDCPDSCGWQVTVQQGVAVKMRGNPAHPFSQGELCPKVNRFLDRVYSPDRILYPMRRVGPKGSGQFARTSWNDALAEIAERTHHAIAAHGGQTVFGWNDAGNQGLLQMSSTDRRLFAKIGASQMTGSVCGMTSRYGAASTNGSGKSIDPMDLRYSKFIILWGTNTKLTNRHLWPIIEAARADGAEVVLVDPMRTATAEAVDCFIQPLPGTDAAMALAMMHVIIRDNLVDHDYVANYTLGYDELVAHVATMTPEWAAGICGIDASTIESLARRFATASPAVIRTLIGAEHHENGAMLFRTLTCLPLLTGAWRERGGGYCRSVGTWSGVDINDSVLSVPSLSDGKPRRGINQSLLGAALTDATMNPPITSLFVWCGNPLVTLPNSEQLRRGLERDDLFTVVHEQFLTDTARYADIVLPATTQIEHRDVVPAWGHLYIGWNEKAIEPLGESVRTSELWRQIAAAMGYTEPELYVTDDELIGQALATVDIDALRRDGFVRLNLPEDLRPFAEGGFETPSGKGEFVSASLAAEGHPSLPTFMPPRESPHGDSDLYARYPLVLFTPKVHTRFLNSSYSQLPKHGPLEGEPFLWLDEMDAKARGIADGQMCRVFNDRASIEVPARITDKLRPGLVAVPFGWWMSQHGDGKSANSLTNDTLADWGGGVAYLDTLVEVALA